MGRSRKRSVGADVLRGAVAGAVGVYAMDKIGWYLYNREDSSALAREHAARVANLDVAHAAVRKVSELTGTKTSTTQPSAAGLAVHYALGVAPGAIYGVARHHLPVLRAGSGAVYGFGLFLLMDEIAAPLLRVAAGPTKYPWQAHARGLVSHVALGVVTATVVRVLDRGR